MSRNKGAAGEREFKNLAIAHGIRAHRTAQLQAGRVPGTPDVELDDYPSEFVEVKRDERMSVDAMMRQAERDAALSPVRRTPVVAWRRNRKPPYVALPAAHYFDLLRRAA